MHTQATQGAEAIIELYSTADGYQARCYQFGIEHVTAATRSKAIAGMERAVYQRVRNPMLVAYQDFT